MTETRHLLKTPQTLENARPAKTDDASSARLRKHAIAAGVFFLLTDITSIVGLLLYEPLLQHADFITGTGSDLPIRIGAFLETLLAIGVVAPPSRSTPS